MFDVVDLHCDTISVMEAKHREGVDVMLRTNHMHMDLERMKMGGYLCQCFALFSYLEALQSRRESPYEHALKLADYWEEQIISNNDLIEKAVCYQDIMRNKANGKMSALMTVEEGAVYEGEIKKLHALYDRGVRISTLTWNFENELGFPNIYKTREESAVKPGENGLKEAGQNIVQEMEKIGMLIDISHLNDTGIEDVFACTKGPILASHSNTRAVCRHLRNLSDEVIIELAERGGVAGINFCPDFLYHDRNNARMDDMVRHMIHLKKLGGIECISLGSDFDGFGETTDFGGAEGIQSLADAMKKHGFTESEIDKVFSKNALRIIREVLS